MPTTKKTTSKKKTKKSAPKKASKTKKSNKAKERLEVTELEKELATEVRKLTKEVKSLRKLEFVKILKHPWKFLGMSFLKGLMVGFGSVLGASVLVALFLYILSQISFVPIIGDFVEEVLTQIEDTTGVERFEQ